MEQNLPAPLASPELPARPATGITPPPPPPAVPSTNPAIGTAAAPTLPPTSAPTLPAAPPSQPVEPTPSSATSSQVPHGGLRCQACGQHPARHVEFRRHTGMVFAWQHQEFAGALCRSCGLAVFRKYMDHTLYAGWWGLIAFFANFYAIFKNLVNRAKLRSLDPPPQAVEGTPGRPMYLRFGTYFALAGLSFLSFTAYTEITTSDAEGLDGECLQIEVDRLIEVPCSSPHTGKVVGVIAVDGTERCPVLADEVIVLDSDEAHAMCVDLDQ